MLHWRSRLSEQDRIQQFFSFANLYLRRLARKLPVVGNINAFLYKAWAINPNAFTDIVQGDQQDQGCCAANFATVPGWVRIIYSIIAKHLYINTNL
jgi:hypothetical protein